MIKNIIIAVLVLLSIGIYSFSTNSDLTAGGTTNFDTVGLTGLSVGSNGTIFTQIISGSMNCTGAATVAAGAIGNYDCTVSNVVSGDKIFATLSTTTSAHITLAAAYASSTSGSVRLVLANSSTTAAIAPTSATSSVQYLIVR